MVCEMNPKVFCPNLGVYFMRKKHDYSALLKYMYMLEDGYSINYIRCKCAQSPPPKKCFCPRRAPTEGIQQTQGFGSRGVCLALGYMLLASQTVGETMNVEIRVSFPTCSQQ